MDLASIFTIVAAASALIAALAAIWQARLLRLSIRVDSLLRLDAHFNGTDMCLTRRKAACYLLSKKFNPHLFLPEDKEKCRIALDDLLDFFEGLAFLARKRRTPDPEDVWCFFFGYFDHYFRAAKEHIEEEQKKDPLRWCELTCFHKHLIDIERKHRGKYEPTDDNQLRRFLEEEAQLSR